MKVEIDLIELFLMAIVIWSVFYGLAHFDIYHSTILSRIQTFEGYIGVAFICQVLGNGVRALYEKNKGGKNVG